MATNNDSYICTMSAQSKLICYLNIIQFHALIINKLIYWTEIAGSSHTTYCYNTPSPFAVLSLWTPLRNVDWACDSSRNFNAFVTY
jgi:hypothetical protein